MEIRIDDAAMKAAVSEAVFAAMDQQKKDVLIQGAIQHLMTRPNSDGYGRRASPLEDAFQSSVREVAMKIATEELSKDTTFMDKLRSLLNDAIVQITETNREATVTKIAEAITAGMSKRDHY